MNGMTSVEGDPAHEAGEGTQCGMSPLLSAKYSRLCVERVYATFLNAQYISFWILSFCIEERFMDSVLSYMFTVWVVLKRVGSGVTDVNHYVFSSPLQQETFNNCFTCHRNVRKWQKLQEAIRLTRGSPCLFFVNSFSNYFTDGEETWSMRERLSLSLSLSNLGFFTRDYADSQTISNQHTHAHTSWLSGNRAKSMLATMAGIGSNPTSGWSSLGFSAHKQGSYDLQDQGNSVCGIWAHSPNRRLVVMSSELVLRG